MITFAARRPGDAVQAAITIGCTVTQAVSFTRLRGWWLLTVAA